MSFEGFRRERNTRRVLRALAGQRVAMILQPGHVLVVENAPSNLPFQQESLNTCLLRGWIEVLHEGVPTGQLSPGDTSLPDQPFTSRAPIYRITDSGWSVINRTHFWVISTFAVALLALIASVLTLWRP
jgi:hypothetical protein